MAVSWGTPEGSNGIKVGIELIESPSTVSASTTSVTVTCKIWAWTEYGYDDAQTLTYSGSWSGTSAEHISTSVSTGAGWSTSNQQLLATLTKTVTPSHTSAITVSCTATLSGNYQGSSITPSKTLSTSISARPYYAPSAVTGLTAWRSSGANNTITWTNTGGVDDPYSSLRLEYSLDGSTWTTINSSLAPTDTDANAPQTYVHPCTNVSSFQYRVIPTGPGGTGSAAVSGWTTRVPKVPVSCSATPNVTTSDEVSTLNSVAISVGAATSTSVELPEYWYVEMWDSVSNSWNQKYSGAVGAGPYTTTVSTGLSEDTSFQFRSRTSNDAGYSGYVYSGAVKSKPNAPTGTIDPTKLQLTKTGTTEITLNWNNPSNIETGTEVWWSYYNGSVWSDFVKIATLSANATSYVHSSLDSSKQHKYFIRNVVE